MNTKLLLSASALALFVAAPVMAQSPAPEAVVNFTMSADMKSVKDNTQKDTFTLGLADAQVATSFEMKCQAGRTQFLVKRTDRGCEVSGKGALKGPNNALIQRTQYQGGYLVKSDGVTDATSIKVNYLAAGKVPASSGQFGGSMNLKPELNSSGAQALTNLVMSKLEDTGGGLIDKRVDTIDFNRLVIPSAGLPSDKGTSLTGNLVYAYQTESWYITITATYDGKEYKLKGNMPYIAAPDGETKYDTRYDLTLTTADANNQSDDALFVSDSGDGDLFASVDGISGHILMKEGNLVTIKVDNADEEVPSQIDATGTFTGTNVPLPVVRAVAQVISINAPGFFGG